MRSKYYFQIYYFELYLYLRCGCLLLLSYWYLYYVYRSQNSLSKHTRCGYTDCTSPVEIFKRVNSSPWTKDVKHRWVTCSANNNLFSANYDCNIQLFGMHEVHTYYINFWDIISRALHNVKHNTLRRIIGSLLPKGHASFRFSDCTCYILYI